MGQERLDPISQLSLLVFRAQQSLSSVGDELTARWAMTSAQWKVLGAVELSDSPPSAADIGRMMGMTRQAATKQIGLLVAQELLIAHVNPLDARAAIYTLSPKGSAVYGEISDAWSHRVNAIRTVITDTDLASAHAVLEQLVVQLEKARTTSTSKPSIARQHQGATP